MLCVMIKSFVIFVCDSCQQREKMQISSKRRNTIRKTKSLQEPYYQDTHELLNQAKYTKNKFNSISLNLDEFRNVIVNSYVQFFDESTIGPGWTLQLKKTIDERQYN